MKIKTVCLASMLVLTTACAFVAQGAKADNDGDYTPTTNVQWWWKYVRPIDSQQKWTQVVLVSEASVDKAIVNARTQEASNAVLFTFANRSAQTVECDGSVRIVHTIRGRDGSVIYMEELLPARLPKALRPGETFQVRGVALTPEKFRGNAEFLDVTAR